MKAGSFTHIITALGQSFGSLSELLADDTNFRSILNYLGLEDGSMPSNYQQIVIGANSLQGLITSIGVNPNYSDLIQIVGSISNIVRDIESITNAPTGVENTSFVSLFKIRLFELVLANGLQSYLPQAYYLLSVLKIVSPNGIYFYEDDDQYEGKSINLESLKEFIEDPTSYLKRLFAFEGKLKITEDFQNDVSKFLRSIGSEINLIESENASNNHFDGAIDAQGRGLLYLSFSHLISNRLTKAFSFSFGPESVFDEDVDIEQETDVNTGNSYLSPLQPFDELKFGLISSSTSGSEINISNELKISFANIAGALSIRIGSRGINFNDIHGNPLTILNLDPAFVLSYQPIEPIILIGDEGRTRLQADKIQITLRLGITSGIEIELKTINSQLYINSNEGDSFISKILPISIIPLPLNVSLSSKEGLRFNSKNSIRVNVPKNIKFGHASFENILIGVESNSLADFALFASANISIEFGPVAVSANGVGASFSIVNLISPKDIAFGFKLPTGIGISVDSDAIKGGGYLYSDAANHQYAGVATLTIKEVVKVNALGLLQTQLPDNRPGYSFLLLITAEFTPIQLGLGFTLNGLGGLVGIHRAANTRYLRDQIRTGNLTALLFPQNVLDDPSAALAIADAAFPATEDRYVFGLMAKLGWGVPTTLLTLDLGLIIELPAPVRLVLLGSLQATFPDERARVLRLRADFVGVLDFGAKTAEFDASLVNSALLGFDLTGDLAFRLYWGDSPLFLLTAGGFHPAFQPPANANLPTLRRITLTFANNNDFRLLLYSYFAVTSNTVQFGSRLELYLDLPASYYLIGFLGFDALFQFHPFHLEVSCAAGVAIKKGNATKLGIFLALNVSGPGPWHVQGTGEFRLLGIKIKFRINRTFGGSAPAQPLESVNVRELLRTSLAKPDSWQVEAPATRPAGGAVLRAEPAAGTLLIDPSGTLVVRQQVVPLAYRISRYGTAQPAQGTHFAVTGVTVGGQAATLTGQAPVDDFFSPSQFQQLSDAQKLSAPSFQRLPSGVRVGGLDQLTSGAPITLSQVHDYEWLLLRDIATDTSAARQELNPSAYTLSLATQQRLAQHGAVGRAAQSYEQRRPSQLAPDQVHWDEDDYLIVTTAELAPYAPAGGPFAAESQATTRLQELLAQTPALAGQLQILPAYQLAIA